MRFVLCLLLPACAPTIEQRCNYEARKQAQIAWLNPAAQWCKDGDDGVKRCWSPTAGDFYKLCLEHAARPTR